MFMSKRIKFTELGFKKNADTFIVVLGILLVFISIVLFFYDFQNKLSIFPALLIALMYFPIYKNYCYKNFFYWNKVGGTLRIDSKRVRFNFFEIDSIFLNQNTFSIIEKNNNTFDFNISKIEPKDTIKLVQLFEKHVQPK